MLVFWQALAFTACALLDLLPSTEVYCRFDVSVLASPPAPSEPAPLEATSAAPTVPCVRAMSMPSGSNGATIPPASPGPECPRGPAPGRVPEVGPQHRGSVTAVRS
jgi:hypothetical protein